jgi:hypothetical protein
MITTLLAFAAAGDAAVAAAQVCADRRDIAVMFALDQSSSMAGAGQTAASSFAVALLDELQATGHLARAGAAFWSLCYFSTGVGTNISNVRTELMNYGIFPTAGPGCDGTALFDAIVAGAQEIYAVPLVHAAVRRPHRRRRLGQPEYADHRRVGADTGRLHRADRRRLHFAAGDAGRRRLARDR